MKHICMLKSFTGKGQADKEETNTFSICYVIYIRISIINPNLATDIFGDNKQR
jgi:hypothetical protein